MNNDYMNDEMEIDLIELMKDIIKNIKFIITITLVCGVVVFGVSQFILPKSYTSSIDITIVPAGTSLDYTSYLTGSKVLNKVSNKIDFEMGALVESIEVTRDSNNTYNYNIKATTNDPKLSYRIVKNVVNEFKKLMVSELNLSSVTTMNEPQINTIPVSPNVKKNTLIGTFIGLVISVGIVVLRFLFDKHLRNAEEAEMFLGVDVLAEIPLKK